MKHFQIEPWEHLRKDSAFFSCLSNLVSYRFSQREVLGPTLATDTCKKTLGILAIPWFSSQLLLRSFAVFAEAASFRCLVKAENQLGWSRRPDLTHPFVLHNEVWEGKKNEITWMKVLHARGRQSAMEVQCMGIIISTKPFLKLRHGSLPGYYSKSNARPLYQRPGSVSCGAQKMGTGWSSFPKASLPSCCLLTSWDCLREKYCSLLLLFWLLCSPCKGHHLWHPVATHTKAEATLAVLNTLKPRVTQWISPSNCQPHICTNALKNQ